MDPRSIDPHLTAKIVRSYVQNNAIGAAEVSDLITSVHQALAQLGIPEQPEEMVPAVSVRRSVSQNEVVCMDCGYRGKTLRRHLSTRHGLSRDEYLKRWRLPYDHLLTAPAYSERRSVLAKKLGLVRKPATQVVRVSTRTPVPLDPNPKPEVKVPGRRRPRSASRSRGVHEAAAGQVPATRRRPRPRTAPTQDDLSPAANS
jgi:MucR family transcriptional regulator, transcriptional regulator of exopolysaccharide biosynthesis